MVSWNWNGKNNKKRFEENNGKKAKKKPQMKWENREKMKQLKNWKCVWIKGKAWAESKNEVNSLTYLHLQHFILRNVWTSLSSKLFVGRKKAVAVCLSCVLLCGEWITLFMVDGVAAAGKYGARYFRSPACGWVFLYHSLACVLLCSSVYLPRY